jgi:hypothetical protein
MMYYYQSYHRHSIVHGAMAQLAWRLGIPPLPGCTEGILPARAAKLKRRDSCHSMCYARHMDKPKCRLCGYKHNLSEPHIIPDAIPSVKAKTVAPVTDTVTPVTSKMRPHCPTCTCQKKLTHAERQRAYRARKT